MTPEERARSIKAHARELGFESVGITDLSPTPHGDALREWLEAGFAGTMDYMRRQASRRLAPATISPGARYAIVVTKHYLIPAGPPAPGRGRVAKYARGRDYHDALRPALDALADTVRAVGGDGTTAKVYIDAGPVPERELAQRAGLGWIGKNTMFIEPDRGSYSFIATVLTNLELPVDHPFEPDRCGSCTRCLDACPTDAFVAERTLDSRRCISYLTIEHRGEIDASLAALLDDWIFGCDVCQDVCPWNHKFAEFVDGTALGADPTLASVDLTGLLNMDGREFERGYGTTPFTRPGLAGMQRNARIVAQNLMAGTS